MEFDNIQRPLVSCLCVTRNKSHMLPVAIECFRAQSYDNKELIIVWEDDDRQVEDLLRVLGDDDIKTVTVKSDPKLTLGALRNLSIEQSSGAFFCQWDDDDWYHNERLEIQMSAIQRSGKQASILTNWLIYNANNSESYLSFDRFWEGVFYAKKVYLEYINIRMLNLEKTLNLSIHYEKETFFVLY